MGSTSPIEQPLAGGIAVTETANADRGHGPRWRRRLARRAAASGRRRCRVHRPWCPPAGPADRRPAPGAPALHLPQVQASADATDLARHGSADLVVFAVKLGDTAAAARAACT